MKTFELRIGNLIQLDPTRDWIYGDGELGLPKGVYSVKSISEEGINCTNYAESGLYWESLDRHVGIPITEEWLSKFGVEKDNDPNHEIFGKYDLPDIQGWPISIEEQENRGTEFSVQVNEEYEIAKIEYVHQLQNLYFSLTGQELKING